MRQNNALGGRGLRLGLGFRGLVLRLLAAAAMLVATPAAASAVFQPELRGFPSETARDAVESLGLLFCDGGVVSPALSSSGCKEVVFVPSCKDVVDDCIC